MAFNYSQYETDSPATDNTDKFPEDVKLTFGNYAPFSGVLTKVFGVEKSWGQTLGVKFENVRLHDGVAYRDPEKGTYKLFGWPEVVGMQNTEDNPVDKSEAPDPFVKTYQIGGTKRYELVEAVSVIEDEPVPILDNAIVWLGTNPSGPKPISKTLCQTLTIQGRDMLIPEEEAGNDWKMNWLADVSREDVTRPDLLGKEITLFTVEKSLNGGNPFNHPTVLLTETDTLVKVGSTTRQAALPMETETEEVASDDGEIPSAIENFMASAETLGYVAGDQREEAGELMDMLVADTSNDLTENVIDAFGGRDAVLDLLFG